MAETMDIEKIVILTVAKTLNIAPSLIHYNSSIVGDLGADSLDQVELIMEFEDIFGVTIAEEDAERIETVGNICDYFFKITLEKTSKAEELLAQEKKIYENTNILQEREEKKRQVISKIPAISITGILTFYYLVIFAHWDFILKWVTKSFSMFPVLLIYFISFVFVSITPASGKLYYLIYSRDVRTRMKILKFSLLVVIGYTFVFFIIPKIDKIKNLWVTFLKSQYIKNYQNFWILIVVGLVYFLIFYQIKKRNVIYDFLEGFKTFPIVSPIFCFGAPVFWEKSLNYFGITGRTTKLLGIISFISGISFLFGLIVFYAFIKPKKNNAETLAKSSIILLSKEETEVPKHTSNKNEILSLSLIMAGLLAITYVILRISYLAITA